MNQLLWLATICGLVFSNVVFAGKPAQNSQKCVSALVSPKLIQKVLGYNQDVLARIKKHRPELYAEIAAAASSKDPEQIARYKAADAYRGASMLPEHYSAVFTDNRFFTGQGENWFSTDVSTAWNFTYLNEESGFSSYQEVLDAGHSYWGVMIIVQLPAYMVEEGYHERYRDFSAMRSDLGNESVFITEVSVKFLKKRSGEIELVQKILTYQKFKSMFGSENKTLL